MALYSCPCSDVSPHSRLQLSPDLQCCLWMTWPRMTEGGLPHLMLRLFNRFAMMPADDMAQSNGARVGPKGPKCWPQASAGDYKGAQPPYLADKRPEGALSASFNQYIQFKFENLTDFNNLNLSSIWGTEYLAALWFNRGNRFPDFKNQGLNWAVTSCNCC